VALVDAFCNYSAYYDAEDSQGGFSGVVLEVITHLFLKGLFSLFFLFV